MLSCYLIFLFISTKSNKNGNIHVITNPGIEDIVFNNNNARTKKIGFLFFPLMQKTEQPIKNII